MRGLNPKQPHDNSAGLAAIKDPRVRYEVLLEFLSVVLPEYKNLVKDHL